MTSLGIDLSLRNTGCVFLLNLKITKKNCLPFLHKTFSYKTQKEGTTPFEELKRLLSIKEKVINLALDSSSKINIVVIEGLSFAPVRTQSIMQLAGLNYMVRDQLFLNEMPFVIVPPTQLKKYITGKGNCGKELMLLETYKRYKQSFTDNNLCDAYGLAQIGLALLESNTKTLTKFQKEIIKQLKLQLCQQTNLK